MKKKKRIDLIVAALFTILACAAIVITIVFTGGVKTLNTTEYNEMLTNLYQEVETNSGNYNKCFNSEDSQKCFSENMKYYSNNVFKELEKTSLKGCAHNDDFQKANKELANFLNDSAKSVNSNGLANFDTVKNQNLKIQWSTTASLMNSDCGAMISIPLRW